MDYKSLVSRYSTRSRHRCFQDNRSSNRMALRGNKNVSCGKFGLHNMQSKSRRFLSIAHGIDTHVDNSVSLDHTAAVALQHGNGLARQVLSQSGIEGNPLAFLKTTEAYWKVCRLCQEHRSLSCIDAFAIIDACPHASCCRVSCRSVHWLSLFYNSRSKRMHLAFSSPSLCTFRP
jgi:hypothetical protein